jgi:hypothetical protein
MLFLSRNHPPLVPAESGNPVLRKMTLIASVDPRFHRDERVGGADTIRTLGAASPAV